MLKTVLPTAAPPVHAVSSVITAFLKVQHYRPSSSRYWTKSPLRNIFFLTRKLAIHFSLAVHYKEKSDLITFGISYFFFLCVFFSAWGTVELDIDLQSLLLPLYEDKRLYCDYIPW